MELPADAVDRDLAFKNHKRMKKALTQPDLLLRLNLEGLGIGGASLRFIADNFVNLEEINICKSPIHVGSNNKNEQHQQVSMMVEREKRLLAFTQGVQLLLSLKNLKSLWLDDNALRYSFIDTLRDGNVGSNNLHYLHIGRCWVMQELTTSGSCNRGLVIETQSWRSISGNSQRYSRCWNAWKLDTGLDMKLLTVQLATEPAKVYINSPCVLGCMSKNVMKSTIAAR